MTTKEKTQALLLVTVLLCMLVAGILFLRSSRHAPSHSPSSPLRAHEVQTDSSENLLRTPDNLATTDSAQALLTFDSSWSAMQHIANVPESTRINLNPVAPVLSDTLRRYGLHATTMQMLIELLEEKELLMEEKVELSRRLEIVEILDSALVYKTASDSMSALNPTPIAPALDSLLSQKRDTLKSTLPATKPDTLKFEGVRPPLE